VRLKVKKWGYSKWTMMILAMIAMMMQTAISKKENKK
jgi:hypothetical protein